MLHPGLVSVTFRDFSVPAIVDLTVQAGLEGIEWGGDIHVPPGDFARAEMARGLGEKAGLQVSAYGSYYRVGHEGPCPFETILDTALALGAPIIRVWAGKRASKAAGSAYRQRVIADSRRIADLAAEAGLLIAYEFHGGTLTDGLAPAKRLLQAVDHDHVKAFWQPPLGCTAAEGEAMLDALAPWLSNCHVFTWLPGEGEAIIRLPLSDGENAWKRYLRKLACLGGDRFVSLEFVKGDDQAQFLADAATLTAWLDDLNPGSP